MLDYRSNWGLKPWAKGKSGYISAHTVWGCNSTHAHIWFSIQWAEVCVRWLRTLVCTYMRVCAWTCICVYTVWRLGGMMGFSGGFFTYRMACSGKRSGSTAFSQWTTRLSGWCGMDSLAGSIINMLRKKKKKKRQFRGRAFSGGVHHPVCIAYRHLKLGLTVSRPLLSDVELDTATLHYVHSVQ